MCVQFNLLSIARTREVAWMWTRKLYCLNLISMWTITTTSCVLNRWQYLLSKQVIIILMALMFYVNAYDVSLCFFIVVSLCRDAYVNNVQKYVIQNSSDVSEKFIETCVGIKESMIGPYLWQNLPNYANQRTHVIVLRTSDWGAQEIDTSGSLSGVLGKPELSTFYISYHYSHIQDQHGKFQLKHYIIWYKIAYIRIKVRK